MKPIFISILIAGVLIVVALVATPGSETNNVPAQNVTVEEGKQIVEIDVVSGGYSPRVSYAKAGIPTVLRMNTTGFLSCASALSLPSIRYRENLPLNGKTDIEIPIQEAGTSFRGLCAMGMYSFEVKFEG